MFNKTRIRPRNIILTLLTILLVGGVLLFAPGSTPTATAQTADLTLKVFAPAYAPPGGNITYTLEVENVSNTDFTNVGIFHIVPEHTTYVEGLTPVTGPGGQSVTHGFTNIPANSVQTVTWVAQVDSSTLGGTVITNGPGTFGFYPFAGTGIGVSGQNTTVYDLSLTLTGPAYVEPGRYINYRLEVKNVSNQTITDVDIYNDLPANINPNQMFISR